MFAGSNISYNDIVYPEPKDLIGSFQKPAKVHFFLRNEPI